MYRQYLCVYCVYINTLVFAKYKGTTCSLWLLPSCHLAHNVLFTAIMSFGRQRYKMTTDLKCLRPAAGSCWSGCQAGEISIVRSAPRGCGLFNFACRTHIVMLILWSPFDALEFMPCISMNLVMLIPKTDGEWSRSVAKGQLL